MEKHDTETSLPSLAVDAGGLLFENSHISPTTLAQDKVTAEGIVTAYNMMNYEAVAVSANELAAGLDFLLSLKDNSAFTWLSANLITGEGKKLLFTPSVISKVGKLTVGIIGLTGAGNDTTLFTENNLELLPWQDVLFIQVEALAKQTDMIILLSSLTKEENSEIARLHPDIHIIVQADARPANLEPQLINNTLLCQTVRQGKYLGILQISWGAGKRWQQVDRSKLLQQKKNYLDRLNWQMSRYSRNGDPAELYKNDPTKLKAYERLKQSHDALLAEINTIENEIAAQGSPEQSLSTAQNSFIALDTKLPDRPDVLKVVEGIKETVNSLGKKQAGGQPGNSPDNNALTKAVFGESFPYTGWSRCSPCHAEETSTWRQTRHAEAYRTLVEQKQEFNIDCLHCHVTGIENRDDPLALILPRELKAVGCEVCHGPGRDHIKAPESNKLVVKPAEAVCTKCHTPEQDDNFDYNAKLQLIGH